ncbi:MAG TPA: SMP-30/gluconolactonase/LRE family protein [Isosphaeraceae bacterium]|nr:SMP-30/gluconolactonase/LRE family protein [Isosphaeraceae bacterium]
MTARRVLVRLLLVLGGSAGVLHAEGPTGVARVEMPTELLAPGAALSVAARTSFLEGPAVDAAGNLFFSDIINNRILRMTPAGAVSIFREDSGRTNGNTFDALGRLISCEGAESGPGGRRRVIRTDLSTGDITVLTDRYDGKRYNSPNDVCVDPSGRIWFTDPYYGDDLASLEMGVEAVYRIELDGRVSRPLAPPRIERPNGLAVTPDGKALYLVDSNAEAGGSRKVWAFAIADDGSLGHQRLIFDFGKGRGGDGLRLDRRGNLWIAAGTRMPRHGETADVPPGIYVVSPGGKLLGRIPIPEDLTTNLAFGGLDRKTLFITAGTAIYKIPVQVEGYSLYPPREP